MYYLVFTQIPTKNIRPSVLQRHGKAFHLHRHYIFLSSYLLAYWSTPISYSTISSGIIWESDNDLNAYSSLDQNLKLWSLFGTDLALWVYHWIMGLLVNSGFYPHLYLLAVCNKLTTTLTHPWSVLHSEGRHPSPSRCRSTRWRLSRSCRVSCECHTECLPVSGKGKQF